jgi:cell shape-determining protein MreD
VVLIAGALPVLGRVKIIWPKVSQRVYAIACWTITVCMFLGALLNFAIPRFWDRFVFGPIFLILFLLSIIISLPEKENT